jgi:hypothetical protein
MQVRVKANVKFGDNFYTKGDILDMPYVADELYFEEVEKEEAVKEVKPKKKKLAK